MVTDPLIQTLLGAGIIGMIGGQIGLLIAVAKLTVTVEGIKNQLREAKP